MVAENHRFRLVVAHHCDGLRVWLREHLPRFEVCGEAASALEADEVVFSSAPDVMVVGDRFEDGLGVDVAMRAAREYGLHSVLLAGEAKTPGLEAATREPCITPVIDPDAQTPGLLGPIAAAALSSLADRLHAFEGVTDRVEGLERSLDERRLVERAKGVLIALHNLTEDEAHRTLQGRATRARVTLVAAAARILAHRERVADRDGAVY